MVAMRNREWDSVRPFLGCCDDAGLSEGFGDKRWETEVPRICADSSSRFQPKQLRPPSTWCVQSAPFTEPQVQCQLDSIAGGCRFVGSTPGSSMED